MLDERATKALAEVEKAKERRREVERKRAADAELRARKEEARLAKIKEKEEQVAAKKAAAAAAQDEKEKEKEKKAPTEKEIKQAEALAKQKNLFMSFLKKVPKPCEAEGVPLRGSADSSGSSSHMVIDVDAVVATITPASTPSPRTKVSTFQGLSSSASASASAHASISSDCNGGPISSTNTVVASTPSAGTELGPGVGSGVPKAGKKERSRGLAMDRSPRHLLRHYNPHFDNALFEKQISGDMSMTDIARSYKKRWVRTNESKPTSEKVQKSRGCVG